MRLIDADALSKRLCETTIYIKSGEVFQRMIHDAPTVEAVDCSGLIKWLLDEIMDEENWELNAVAYGEIIARKLKKLGLLEVKDGYYVRTPSDDAVEVVRCKDCIQKHIGGSVTQYYWCDFWDREVDCNNGCSWGERKGGDDE